jgi:class 3 adenylate cyclase
MTSLSHLLFQRFADPAAERRYRRESREAQVKFIRALMIIGPLMIGAYIVINPVFVEPSFAARMLLSSLVTLPPIAFYYWYVGRPGYAENRWIDVAFFVLIAAIQFFFIRDLWRSGVSGWPFYAILCYNQQLLLTFACLAFAASVRAFVVWTLISVGYVVITLIVLAVPTGAAVYTATFYMPFAGLVAYVNWAIDDKARRLYAVGLSLDAEKKKSDALLYNVLPQSVAHRLQSGEAVADAFTDVTIVFVDIVGFTKMSQAMEPSEVVALLNAYFARADAACDLFGVEKVKTIGDAYMAVAGAIVPTPRPAKAVVDFARYLIAATREVSREFGIDFKLHIGINTGPVVGGVIAGKKMLYDYWGDAINVASRLEGVAPANGITVSERTWRETRDAYPYHPPRTVTLKGIGETEVYDVEI